MMISFIIFISLYALTCFAHAFSNYKNYELIRRITKPFCMLFLAASVISLRPNYPLLYISVFLAMIGDILLLFKNNKILFVIGGAFFASEDLILFIIISRFLNYFPFYFYIITYVLVFSLGSLCFLKKEKKLVSFFTFSYLNFHLSNLIISIIAIITTKNLLFLLVISGYLFFIFSDYLIAHKIFVRDFKNRGFYLILTYLIAQSMIILGLTFILWNI